MAGRKWVIWHTCGKPSNGLVCFLGAESRGKSSMTRGSVFPNTCYVKTLVFPREELQRVFAVKNPVMWEDKVRHLHSFREPLPTPHNTSYTLGNAGLLCRQLLHGAEVGGWSVGPRFVATVPTGRSCSFIKGYLQSSITNLNASSHDR